MQSLRLLVSAFLFFSFCFISFSVLTDVSSRQCPRPETGLQSTASQDVRDAEDDPFLRVAKTSASVPNSDLNEIFDPVKELGTIIEEMESPAAHKDRASGSPRLGYVKFS